MKALTILGACLALAVASPSQALVFRSAAPHPGPMPHAPRSPPHPGQIPPGAGNGHHGHGGKGYFDPFNQGIVDTYPDPSLSNSAQLPPDFALPPAPFCPTYAPAPHRNPGPHIIYIGAKPTINGPKVIYGTD